MVEIKKLAKDKMAWQDLIVGRTIRGIKKTQQEEKVNVEIVKFS